MPHLSSLPRATSFESIEVGASKSPSTPGCLTGFKRFLHRLLARGTARATAQTPRQRLAESLEDLVRNEGGPALGLRAPDSRVPLSVHHRVLGQLLTNNWDAPPGSHAVQTGCAFPENHHIEQRLESIRSGWRPPLFETPRAVSVDWDAPLPITEREKMLSLSVDALQWPLSLLRRVGEQNADRSPGRPGVPSENAVMRSLDAIRLVQSLMVAYPQLTLRQLLEEFPSRLAEWQGIPQDVDMLVEDWSMSEAPKSAKVDPCPMRPTDVDLSDVDLSALLRKADPANPFRRRDSTLAHLLRETIALRKRSRDDISLDEAAALRNKVRQTLAHRSDQVERLRAKDLTAERELRQQLQTLARMIVHIEERYDIAPWRPFPKRH